MRWMFNVSESTIGHYMNATKSVDQLQLATIVACAIVFIVGILGNLLVVIVFGSRLTKIKAGDLFFTNLALADLLICIIVPGDKIYHIMGGNYRAIGHIGCKCIHFVSITSVGVSSLTLLAISLDRYIIVRAPLRPRLRFRYLVGACLLIWCLSGLLGVPYLMEGNIKLHVIDNNTQLMVCRGEMNYEDYIIHTFITFVVQVIAPMVIITIMCSLIAYELHQVLKSDLFLNRDRITRSRFKQNRKTVILLVVLVLSFFTCVTPVNIFYLVYTFKKHGLSVKTAELVFTILLMLQLVNSCLNPIIYSKLHTMFRHTALSWFFPYLRENLLKFQSIFAHYPGKHSNTFFSCVRGDSVYWCDDDIDENITICLKEANGPILHRKSSSDGGGEMIPLGVVKGTTNC